MVEKPKPLMIDPEKLVRTPLGTLLPNMAMARGQREYRQKGRSGKESIFA